MQKEWTFWQEHLAHVCSQIVFLCVLKFRILLKNTIEIVVSTPPQKEQQKNNKFCVKNWSKHDLRTGRSMLRNKLANF